MNGSLTVGRNIHRHRWYGPRQESQWGVASCNDSCQGIFFSMEMYPDSEIMGFMYHDDVRLTVNVLKKGGHMQACMSPEGFGIGL